MRVVGQHYEYDTATNVQTKRYYAEGTLLAVRSIPNANPNAQTLRYVQSDHLGSTSTLTDASGQVVARERYSAFGERRRGESPLTTDQLYTGQQYNSLSSLYYYSDGKSAGRFYDPLLARFVQPDSVTPGIGSIALNRYAYADNSPIRYTDPNGQAVRDMADGSGIGAGAMWAIGRAGGVALRAWIIDQVARTLPSVTANADKVPAIVEAIEQNSENTQRAAQSSNEPDAGGADPNDPKRGGGSRETEGLSNALKPGAELAKQTADRAAEAAKDAYEVAKAGGKHSGMLDNYGRRPPSQVAKAIRSIEATIQEHLQKITDPAQAKLEKPWVEMSPAEQQRAINDWTRDIIRNQEELNVLRGLYATMKGDE